MLSEVSQTEPGRFYMATAEPAGNPGKTAFELVVHPQGGR